MYVLSISSVSEVMMVLYPLLLLLLMSVCISISNALDNDLSICFPFFQTPVVAASGK